MVSKLVDHGIFLALFVQLHQTYIGDGTVTCKIAPVKTTIYMKKNYGYSLLLLNKFLLLSIKINTFEFDTSTTNPIKTRKEDQGFLYNVTSMKSILIFHTEE